MDIMSAKESRGGYYVNQRRQSWILCQLKKEDLDIMLAERGRSRYYKNKDGRAGYYVS